MVDFDESSLSPLALSLLLACSTILLLYFFAEAKKSGRQDLNLRPLRPERSALAKLSYAPMS